MCFILEIFINLFMSFLGTIFTWALVVAILFLVHLGSKLHFFFNFYNLELSCISLIG